MNFDEYVVLAQRTGNNLGNRELQLTRAAMGMAGEAGEFCDDVKKVLFHGVEVDVPRLVKEAGDVLWYLADASVALGVPLSRIAELNIEKLKKRYPEGFTTEASLAKADEGV